MNICKDWLKTGSVCVADFWVWLTRLSENIE